MDSELSQTIIDDEAEATPLAASGLATPVARSTSKKEPALNTERRFLAVASEADNLAVALECLYTAQLLKQRHPGVRAGILTHPANRDLFVMTGVFDDILDLPDESQIRAGIVEYEADVLYLPNRGLRVQLAAFFSGARVRIGGSRNRLIARLLRFHKIHREDDLARLKKRGYDLFPELTGIGLSGAPPCEVAGLPTGEFIWLSLFDDHDLTGAWPPGNAARLGRLLATLNLAIVVPLPRAVVGQTRLAGEIAYLKKNTDIVFLENCLPARRAAAMLRSSAVIAPAGPETILASILKKPVVVLHDMKTYRNEPGHVRPPGLHAEHVPEAAPPGAPAPKSAAATRSALKEALRVFQTEHGPLTSYYIKLADSIERHVMPSVDECVKNCDACGFHSCVEFISPERVFEQLKKAILPF